MAYDTYECGGDTLGEVSEEFGADLEIVFGGGGMLPGLPSIPFRAASSAACRALACC
jgi:hypothetical protein